MLRGSRRKARQPALIAPVSQLLQARNSAKGHGADVEADSKPPRRQRVGDGDDGGNGGSADGRPSDKQRGPGAASAAARCAGCTGAAAGHHPEPDRDQDAAQCGPQRAAVATLTRGCGARSTSSDAVELRCAVDDLGEVGRHRLRFTGHRDRQVDGRDGAAEHQQCARVRARRARPLRRQPARTYRGHQLRHPRHRREPRAARDRRRQGPGFPRHQHRRRHLYPRLHRLRELEAHRDRARAGLRALRQRCAGRRGRLRHQGPQRLLGPRQEGLVRLAQGRLRQPRQQRLFDGDRREPGRARRVSRRGDTPLGPRGRHQQPYA